MFLGLGHPVFGHGEPSWSTLTPADITRLMATSSVYEMAPFLPVRLRSARTVQRAADHIRYDRDGDGVCEGHADAVGRLPRWYGVLGRATHEETLPEIGRAQVDTLKMDWRGLDQPSLLLTGHTPLDRVKTVYFLVSVDLDANGVHDLVVEMRPPRPLIWETSYQYRDAAERLDMAQLLSLWRGRLVHDLVRDFYDGEYFFNHGPEFASAYTAEQCK